MNVEAIRLRRQAWNEIGDAAQRFYIALRRTGMDTGDASTWVIGALRDETERINQHGVPASWEVAANDPLRE